MQVLDADRTEVPAGIVEPHFAEYLDSFISEPAQKEVICEGSEQRVYLHRNLSKVRPRHSATAPPPLPLRHCHCATATPPRRSELQRRRDDTIDEDETVTEALAECSVFNGLECKMSCSSYKVSYVLNTEDVLVRRKRRKTGIEGIRKARSSRAMAFRSWLEGKAGDVGAAAGTAGMAAAAAAGAAAAYQPVPNVTANMTAADVDAIAAAATALAGVHAGMPLGGAPPAP